MCLSQLEDADLDVSGRSCSDHHAVLSRLMLGFMSGCAFLSMWVHNTTAVTMVMPIVEAVLQQLLKAKEDGGCVGEDNPNLQLDGTRMYILFFFYTQELTLKN